MRIQSSGETVLRAFAEAGIFALVAIAVLLLIALRRIVDVVLTLVPLLIAGIVTLELCVVLDLPLNFATLSPCHCCWASESHSRSITSWHGGLEKPACCNPVLRGR
jgi:hypothetical protein